MAFLFAILTAFILYPVLSVLWIALSDETGNLTLIHFLNFFRRPLFREALWNTLVSGLLVVVFSGLISLPLAYIIARYEFRGKILLQTAATLPLVIPPFVGAVALTVNPWAKRHGQLIIDALVRHDGSLHGRPDRCRARANFTLFSLYLAQYRGLAF